MSASRPVPLATTGRRTAPPDVLALLRERTRSRHDAVEAVVDLLDPALDHARYRTWLHILHGFHAPLERSLAAVDGWSALGLDLAARSRVGWLRTDLDALDRRLGDADARRDGRMCTDLPTPGTLSEALGCLYVLEGSSLGGRVILKHVKATLGLGPLDGARAFAGHGARTGSMWAACRGALQRHVDAGGDADALVNQADATFAALARWIGRSGR